MEDRSGKHHVPHQHKTGRETNQEGYDKSCNMGFKIDEAQIQNLFMQDIIISQEKNEDIQDRIGTPANCIAEGL